MKIKTVCFFVTAVSCLLSGCGMIALPGQEPFGEKTYSDDQAQSVYEEVRAGMEQIKFSDWSGYSVELDEDTVNHDFYRTEDYTVAWHEGAAKYLWYQGRLYCQDQKTIAYRDMDWIELQSDDYAAQQWTLACELLSQEPETLEYKYIPMASENPYLLTAWYADTIWEEQTRQFPRLYVRLDEDQQFKGLTLHWQEGTQRTVDVSYFPYEGSTGIQAERRVWSFAHALGLIEEGVPAISTQTDDRDGCRSAIVGIDFDSVLNQAVYQEDLTFPVPPERDPAESE